MPAPTRVKVACFGSLNRDVTVRLPRFPRPDETLVGTSVTEFRGGKGFNQAIAASRLGADTTMIGAVGDDAAGADLLAALSAQGIDHTLVNTVAGVGTGTAVPLVTDTGEVSIIIVSGANGTVTAAWAQRAAEAIAAADVLVLQGEVDFEASARAAEIARDAGTTVVVNTAPVGEGTTLLFELADIIVANADEAEVLALEPDPGVVITMGALGARAGDVAVPAFPAQVVDPTGAGDSFCAALAVRLAEGADLVDAVRFACAAGALAVAVEGAEPSLPHRAAVDELLAAYPVESSETGS